jgi:hypothetical protein
MMACISKWAVLLLMVLASTSVLAHKASDSFVYINTDQIRLDIALEDVLRIQDLDGNSDAQLSWGELRRSAGSLAGYIQGRMALLRNGELCPLAIRLEGISEHSDGVYAVWMMASPCLASGDALSLTYSLLFDIDPLHRALLVSSLSGKDQLGVLSPSLPEIALSDISALSTSLLFIQQGGVHLLIGYDHLLFLLALLLPATRRTRAGNLKPVFKEVVWLISMFTLAHSLTLISASMNWFALPSQPVEMAIALSITIAAGLLFFDVEITYQRGLAFAVGLIHGFGFAGVLAGLLAESPQKLLALLSFNVGIELAQLALVLIFLPIIYRMSLTAVYQRSVLPVASFALAASGLFMAWQRL